MSSTAGGGEGRRSCSSDSSDREDDEHDDEVFDGHDLVESSRGLEKSDDIEDELSSFREKWKNELKLVSQPEATDESSAEIYIEQEAKSWYLNGSELEKAGKFYEAIQCYKRAVQLVPDIEFRLAEKSIKKPQSVEDFRKEPPRCFTNESLDILKSANYKVLVDNVDDSDVDDEDKPIKEGALLATIQRRHNKALFCEPEHEQKGTHLSQLPMELILYILKWVVSSDLDLRSLEMCSMVSRGFYLCARDEEIWKLTFNKVWGKTCIDFPNMYPTWRDMFLDRAFLFFNGCYISKTTYIRHGENSFQGEFYRPWHFVAYYRYLRFFPDGVVLMLTTADEPSQCVGLLKERSTKVPSIHMGQYLLKEDKVIIVIKHQEKIPVVSAFKRTRKMNDTYDCADRTYHMEFKIQTINKRKHVQLMWTHYSVLTRHCNGSELQSSFDLTNSRFPPLWFSRVKSYAQESGSPLQ